MVQWLHVSFSLTWFEVQMLKQGGLHIAYSHKLDIATTGKSEAQAMDAFSRFARIFEKVTNYHSKKFFLIDAQLLKLGWTKRNKRWAPPAEPTVS